jgi:ATP-binding cassette subfamily B protein
VKAFNTFDGECERYNAANRDLTGISITAHRIMGIFSPIITFCVNMSIVALLWAAPGLLASGGLRVGEVVAFVNYMSQILTSLTVIFNVYQQFIRAKASGERVSEVLGKEDAETGGSLAMSGEIRGGVEFGNVFFSYPGTQGEPVLCDICFNLKPRETLGIIGSTGAGKTSLINLIPGFYKPDTGTVYIDGVDVADYAFDELRRRISVVTQKVQLFTGTIADNIRWGDMDATDAQVEAAARAAQAHDFIMAFPSGYDTVLGQNGVNLSGGQKQRVSIARALIRRPDILILDDCVSAVDVATEAAILKAIHELMGSAACIMITQRISSVMNLPHIIVMDEGRIVGSGDHARLMESCEVYREISRSQLGRGSEHE